MAKKIYTIFVMVALVVFSGIAFTSCGDDEPDNGSGNSLAGTYWYNSSYGLTFTSKTEATLTYRGGGEDYYKVEKSDITGQYNGYPYSLRNQSTKICDWMFRIDDNKMELSTLTGSSKMTMYKDSE